MHAHLCLVTTTPGREGEVRTALEAMPAVETTSILFQEHVVVQVRDRDAMASIGRIDGVEDARTYG